MIDEVKLKKLLAEIVRDVQSTVMPNFYIDTIFKDIYQKIATADLTKGAK